jgi:hypothetical protein
MREGSPREHARGAAADKTYFVGLPECHLLPGKIDRRDGKAIKKIVGIVIRPFQHFLGDVVNFGSIVSLAFR